MDEALAGITFRSLREGDMVEIKALHECVHAHIYRLRLPCAPCRLPLALSNPLPTHTHTHTQGALSRALLAGVLRLRRPRLHVRDAPAAALLGGGQGRARHDRRRHRPGAPDGRVRRRGASLARAHLHRGDSCVLIQFDRNYKQSNKQTQTRPGLILDVSPQLTDAMHTYIYMQTAGGVYPDARDTPRVPAAGPGQAPAPQVRVARPVEM